MTHLKRKLMMTLALLLTAATGAWAQEVEQSESFTTNTGATVYTGNNFKITVDLTGDGDGFVLSSIKYATIEALNGETITKVEFTRGYNDINAFSCEVGTTNISGDVATVSGVNQTSLTVNATQNLQIKAVKVYFITPTASSATPVDLTRGTDEKINEWTLTNGMPAGNVTVSVEYFPQAAFAMSTDATPVALAPKASTSARANTDDPLVEGGTVAGIVDGEAVLEEGQGTLLYHFSAKQLDAAALEALTAADWSDKVPTADGLAEGTVYVYYYIKGADDLPGNTQGAKFTFSDSDIQELAVTLAPEPTYNVEFAEGTNPEAPAEPEWTATPNTGVKKGQTVTVTYTGDRKVIGVKAEKKATKLTITIPATENAAALTLDVTGCTTWEQILNQNRTTLDYEGNGVYGQTSNCYILDGNNNRLNLNTPYDPTTNYHWGTQK